ncbi:hypothetical protein FC83_GL001590 [Agrilactobacillus composti DSM 18527 = JCM 14202]|uniref:Uncharacterized protein n=1 Tax=Agrilactobacillus composti DSM 18527 = JCM 14202 TaxID=1423734 RepID=X0PDF2_9LACO|nr:hypothetical protein [Agrilactobacillus composti]KRM30459.1 hypothetical protein FC83_GL001590 [Agrilactobacillus composti DSM 18527 = JCM 14202]GAF38943.1 hypothetical protein JCM14202_774 [Agrilactobacillus composti DSM 18527 = JCM 14202]
MENSIYLDKGISIHPRHDGIIEIRQESEHQGKHVLDSINYLTARDTFGMTVMQIVPTLTFQEVHSVQQKLNIIYHF